LIRAVDHKAVDMSNDEYDYYQQIIMEYGDKIFQNTFESDENTGFITLVKPPIDRNTPMVVVFALFNIMLNKRIREFDRVIEQYRMKNG